MKQFNTSTLDYIESMKQSERSADRNPNLAMSGCYGKPLPRFELLKRKIKNMLGIK